MPCPWLEGGVCRSPKAPIGQEVFVVGDHCKNEGEYRSCQFYVEPEERGKEGLLAYQPSKDEAKEGILSRYRPYRPIHAMVDEPACRCPFFKAVRGHDGRWYALCKVLDRLLTVSEVKLCTAHWKTCPLYKNGSRLVGGI